MALRPLVLLLLFKIGWRHQNYRVNAADDSNPSLGRCYGYIINDTHFSPSDGPRSIPCVKSENNRYGNQWGPSVHQKNSCCTGDGTFFVQISQIGGFDVIPKGFENISIPILLNTTENIPNQRYFFSDPICQAYTTALQATLCDPLQGTYITLESPPSDQPSSYPTQSIITNEPSPSVSPSLFPSATQSPSASPPNEPSPSVSPSSFPSATQTPSASPPRRLFSICRSSCEKVFDACGLPGVNFPNGANYTDGESFCYNAWGGFFSDGPCDSMFPDGFPCQANLGLRVADDYCLDIKEPTEREIESYIQDRQPPVPEECVSNEANILLIFGVIIASMCGCVCLGGYMWICIRRRQLDHENVGEIN